MSGIRNRALVIDAVATLVIGAAVCAWGDVLTGMLAVVGAVLVARMALWRTLDPAARGHELVVEIAFFALCTVLGAFNDWNTVDRHRVYEYLVSSDLAWSSVPLWMMLFWGQILRTMATAAEWARGDGETSVAREPRRSAFGAAGRIAVMLALVAVTRQCVYRLWDHPFWSWLPFAVAIAVYALVLHVTRTERRLAVIALTVGPAFEAALIGLGGLHRYSLGWFFGVPLWIVLWWVLAVWIWGELSGSILAALRRRTPHVA
ncbi:MAG: hypothetical protein KJ042_04130 [Deltaproteobacteria bacterium]|nr:hypothetical protein [Deltaproteobacteria bacterium]